MKAMQVTKTKQGSTVAAAEMPRPVVAAGEVLIRVRAVGVLPTELGWQPTTHTKDGGERTNAVPGHEFSGVVEEAAEGFSAGQEIYGMNDWYVEGATAEFCVAPVTAIAPKPSTLSHEEAAGVPISALTAWQGLITRAKVKPGERVLVQGGSGAVGIFAVQIAKRQGAHVIATASTANVENVKMLGADEVIDYKTTQFEDVVRDVDVVFDTVGGDTLRSSWSVLKPGGRMITVASSEENSDSREKEAFFIVEPSREQLEEVARMLDAGTLKIFVKAVVPFVEAAAAYDDKSEYQRGFGKIVISI